MSRTVVGVPLMSVTMAEVIVVSVAPGGELVIPVSKGSTELAAVALSVVVDEEFDGIDDTEDENVDNGVEGEPVDVI